MNNDDIDSAFVQLITDDIERIRYPFNENDKVHFILSGSDFNAVPGLNTTLRNTYETNITTVDTFVKNKKSLTPDMFHVYRLWKLFMLRIIIEMSTGEKTSILSNIYMMHQKIPIVSIICDYWDNVDSNWPSQSSRDLQQWFICTLLDLTITCFIDKFGDTFSPELKNYVMTLKTKNEEINTRTNFLDSEYFQMNMDLLNIQYNVLNRNFMQSLNDLIDEQKTKQLNNRIIQLQREVKTNKKNLRIIEGLRMQNNRLNRQIEYVKEELEKSQKKAKETSTRMEYEYTELDKKLKKAQSQTSKELIKEMNQLTTNTTKEKHSLQKELKKHVKQIEEQSKQYEKQIDDLQKQLKQQVQSMKTLKDELEIVKKENARLTKQTAQDTETIQKQNKELDEKQAQFELDSERYMNIQKETKNAESMIQNLTSTITLLQQEHDALLQQQKQNIELVTNMNEQLHAKQVEFDTLKQQHDVLVNEQTNESLKQ